MIDKRKKTKTFRCEWSRTLRDSILSTRKLAALTKAECIEEMMSISEECKDFEKMVITLEEQARRALSYLEMIELDISY